MDAYEGFETSETSGEEWQQARDEFGMWIGYDVSTLGRVRSRKPGREGRIMSGGEGPGGTKTAARTVWLMDSFHEVAKPKRVDALVARAFLGNCPEGERVIHKNGHVWDDRADNLAYGRTTVAPAPPAPQQGAPSVEMATAKVKAAEKALKQAVENLKDAVRELALAEARGSARAGAEGS